MTPQRACSPYPATHTPRPEARAPECSPRRLAASPQAQGASALAQLSRFNRDNQDSVARAGGIKLLVELLAPHHPLDVQVGAADDSPDDP